MSIFINGIEVPATKITPSKAAKMLSKNTMNRERSKSDVDRLVNMIENGEWNKEKPQLFFLTEDGVTLDGQTRERAIVRTGKDMENCYIFSGVDPFAIQEMDTGSARTVNHRFQTAIGFEKSKLAHVKWLGPMLNLPVNKMSTQRLLREFEEHEEALSAITRMRGEKIYNKNLTSKTLWATLGRAYELYSEDESKKTRVLHFAEVLHNAVIYGPEDSAAIVLRDYFSSINVKKAKEHRSVSCAGGGGGQDDVRGSVINAIYAFMMKKPIKKLSPAPETYLRYTWEL